MKNMLKKIDIIKEGQLRSGGLIFALIGFLLFGMLKNKMKIKKIKYS